ncbi:hypothetical protein CPC16_011102 [Podila verticillata]|nr:hypothetical protein CPC16_011102 [Podila verticillata]
MKRSNDYAQSHDAFKKPRVAQGYNNNSNNNNNNYNHGGMGGHGNMGGSMSSDMYGSGGYGSNPMMMSGYGHMGSQYGSQYGGNDQPLSLPAPYQQYPAPSFGTGYGNAPFQVSFPPNAGSNPSGNRTVYIGNVPADATIEEVLNTVRTGLREDFSQYGPIDTIKVLHEKNIAFVHFTTINNAVKAVANLPNDPKYSGRRVNYGKDRCAKNNNNMGNNNSNNNGGAMSNSFGFNASPYPQYGSNMPVSFNPSFDRFPGGGRVGMPRNMFNDGNVNPLTAQGNRTLYLGNIAPETTCEDICNHIRGGILNSIRYFPNKHIAFVSFVDPQAANNFFNQATYQGVTIKNRRLKVGWGQNAHALPAPVIQALSDGATRNVYVGGIDDSITEEKLREDFAEYGETELVNILKEKSCGFVNFTNVMAAVKAVEGIKSKAGYENVRVNFGKDRCGNPPKTLKPYNHNNSNNNHNNNNHSSNNSNGTGVKHESSDDRVKSDPAESDVKDFEDDDEMFQVGA